MKVQRTNEDLWEQVKQELLQKNQNQWTARLAQQAVKIYKERGGKYIGKKDPDNSLSKWTKEDWDYNGEPKHSRYLPKKVRDVLPISISRKENQLKGNKLGEKVAYSNELKKIMKKKDIY